VITLTLLHPIKSIPLQKWNFQSNSVIRVGRAVDNDVVLYSAVVSRYHIKIQAVGNKWALISVGSNGTFINGKKINKVLVKDGMVIRLASSGPKIRITLQEVESSEKILENNQATPGLRSKDISKETVLN
jgi:pSer/pThr/pTyr-binding forkhead associated (FHA) protein